MRVLKNNAILLSRLLGIVLMIASVADAQSARTIYNGHWWLLLTSEEQSGYLNGSADCYSFELNRGPLFDRSFDDIRESVSNFYYSNAEKRSLPVLEVVQIVAKQTPLGKAEKGGEVWSEPHGYWDGQWWRERTGADRLGFVEGYLTCYRSISPGRRGTFSNTATQYVSLINGWYRLDQETGDIDPDRVDTKIADVLFRFRDQAQRSKPGSE